VHQAAMQAALAVLGVDTTFAGQLDAKTKKRKE
jgi:hypothetical protein